MKLAALIAVAGCGRASTLERVEIDDPQAQWAGFAEMVAPIHLPTSLDGTDRITHWLHVPDGHTIGARQLDHGRVVLAYPYGTIADRVELDEPVSTPEHAWHVIDVRGTRTGADGAEMFHRLGPDGTRLVGFEWARGDDAAEHAASEGLDDRLARLNHCQRCHEHDQPAGSRPATDDAGFYSMLDVLSDVAPVETHRPRDLNADDPYIAISNGVARSDLAAAVASGQGHALAVCRSRRYLFDHMDGEARQAFGRAFSECEIR